MNFKMLIVICLSFMARSNALEYEKQFENENICVSRVKIMPQEEIGMHYDVYPQMVLALQGGMLTRIEADGSTTDVEFPTQKTTFRPAESPEKMHKTVNRQSNPIELIIVQFKTESSKS